MLHKHKKLFKNPVLASIVIIATMIDFGILIHLAWAGTGRSDKCMSFACGSATATVDSSRTKISGQVSVKDTSCTLPSDDYGLLRVRFTNGYSTYYTRTYGGCGNYNVENTGTITAPNGAKVERWTFVLCDGGIGGVKCYEGKWVYN
jgi:hypothetical protein